MNFHVWTNARVHFRLMLRRCDKIKVDFAWHEESKWIYGEKNTYNFFETHTNVNMGLQLIHTHAAKYNNNNHL